MDVITELLRPDAALVFAVVGEPMPYRRALSDGRGGRIRHPGADAWKFEVRKAAAKAILGAADADPGLARRLNMERVTLAKGVASLMDGYWGPPEPWFPPGVPLALEATVWVLRPKTHFTKGGQHKKGVPVWPVVPPDASNFGKEIEDALGAWPTGRGKSRGGRALLYRDDAQIVDSRTIKHYADGTTPGAMIRVWVIDSDDQGLDLSQGSD